MAIINDILDLSRIDAGKERIEYAVFSLHSLVESVIEIVLPQAQEKKVKIVNNINPQLPHIKSDIKKCKHIVQNLIGNAVKFTEDGQVTISSSIQSDTVEMVVADTGIGISKENLATVFDEFRQLDDGITKKYEGTGLGLAIVKRYATLLGGSIRVKSEVGVGSEFTLTLPLYSSVNTNSNEIVKAVPSSGVVSSKDHSTHDVLIVEDNESAIIQLQEILEKEGYNIDLAKDGEEAINKINKTKPGAVILDLMLPRIDGFQVLKALRSDETMLDVPVLVLTAKYITREELSTLKGNNIYQLIQKGEVGSDQLLTIINGMFALKDSK